MDEKLKNIRQVLGIEPRSLACRASVLTTTLQPPVSFPYSSIKYYQLRLNPH